MARACIDSAINGLEAQVDALESYRDVLEIASNNWINDALDFDATSPITDPAAMLIDCVESMTTANLGCEVTDIPRVNDFIQDCKNKLRAGMTKAVNDLLWDTAVVATTQLAVLERFLCASLADVLALFDRYSLNRLLDAIYRDQTCITSSAEAAEWAAQIDAQNARIDEVLDDLPVDSSGNFDLGKITEDLSPALTENMEIFSVQSDSMHTAAVASMETQLQEVGDLNPASRF